MTAMWPLDRTVDSATNLLSRVILDGYTSHTPVYAKLLHVGLAEEIRQLIPTRFKLISTWKLIYSMDRDGSSLSTLYRCCNDYVQRRGGFVLVIRDNRENIFGAYLTDAPHPNSHYYGSGECFLWKAILSSPSSSNSFAVISPDTSHPVHSSSNNTASDTTFNSLSSSSQECLHFKAFPNSGINDYNILCESHFFSMGGGDGRYGLWLDDLLNHGSSNTCITFGNQPLSSNDAIDFKILGLQVWFIGY